MNSRISKIWKENRALVLFLILMFSFRSALADWNDVPTGSMKPTILEGDRILVNKMAYDIRVPFTGISLYKLSDPARGDIIVFNSRASGKRLVKRVVGVPGDVIELEDNRLQINGTRLEYEEITSVDRTADILENLSGVTHHIRVNQYGSQLSTFGPVTVPPGQYLAFGDNRDNSIDSRVIGFVPRHEIIGRTKSVILSLNYENHYIPRLDRFFKDL